MTTRVLSMIRLDGRLAIITGATGHLGRVISETLAELGASILLVDRPESDLQELADALHREWAVPTSVIPCDLESAGERAALLRKVTEGALPPSILVNNAAFVGTSELEGWNVPFELQSLDAWRRAMEVNLTAVFDLCKGLMPHMSSAPGASIINIASIYGALGPDWGLYEGEGMSNPAAYAASKGGLIQLTRWLATTAAPHVRVNAVSPGGIERGQPETFRRKYCARTPLGRMATEDDLRGVIAFLASDLGAYITGQNIFIDGGWSAW